MAHPLLSNTPGQRHLLLGNEAIVRGALEAGVAVVTCYPGTPSSEVPDTFFRLSREGDFYFEYSVNEKVALEVAGGASLGGALTLCTMKHVGVNVAADPLMTLAYIGAPGGLVLLSADDPGCHSSQNEQDNRFYARLAGLPCFEPATPQEAKDMARDALLLSRQWEQPVLFRTTTRVNHVRGPVEFGPLPGKAEIKPFAKNPRRFVPVPANARTRHLALLDNLAAIQNTCESSPWNRVWGQGPLRVVASGISRAYLRDVLEEQGWMDRVTVLELGITWPLPERLLTEFLRGAERVLVLEELEPLLENEIRVLAQKQGLDVAVFGKGNQLPRNDEYETAIVCSALHELLEGRPAASREATCAVQEKLPQRPPNLCAGCSHRSVYYAVRQVFGDEAIYSSDIGCYTLGILPPLSAADFLLCMGSSISAGMGMARGGQQTVVAFIGDSTFFHSGITGLVNAVFNQHDLLVVILDNSTTAMTGHQPHPGADAAAIGPGRTRLDIESIVRGCGVTQVKKIRPSSLKASIRTFEEMKKSSGVRVVIAEEPCVLFARRTLGVKPGKAAAVAEQTPDVARCFETLACPAFYRDGDRMEIDEAQCSGCMVCLQIAPGIRTRERGA